MTIRCSPGGEIVDVDAELFAGGIGDAVDGFDRHPGMRVHRIFAAAKIGAAILRIDIDFDRRAACGAERSP